MHKRARHFPVHAHVPLLMVLVVLAGPFFYGWGPALFACGLFLNATAMNRALVCEGRRKVNANANNGGLLQIARQLDTQLEIYNLS